MTNKVDVGLARLLIRVASGDPVDAIEAAKLIIASRDTRSVPVLLDIAVGEIYGKWARIASVYALGLMGDRRCSPQLARVFEDSSESVAVRSHAAEAVGNLRDGRAVAALRRGFLDPTVPLAVKRSVVYALSQIGGRAAVSSLREFERGDIPGRLGRELSATVRALRSGRNQV